MAIRDLYSSNNFEDQAPDNFGLPQYVLDRLEIGAPPTTTINFANNTGALSTVAAPVAVASAPNYENVYSVFGGKDATNDLITQFRSMGLDDNAIASVFAPYQPATATTTNTGANTGALNQATTGSTTGSTAVDNTAVTGGLPATNNTGNVLSGNILAGASWNSTNNTLADQLTASTGLQTINTAVGGATTADTLNQLNTFIDSGGSFAPGSTVYLQTGGVDMLQGIDDATITNNINKIVSTLGAQGVKVVLTTSPRAGSLTDVVNNNFETGPASFYSDIAANNSNVVTVDTMGQILQDKSLLRDALHTNAAGEQIYNKSVMEAYERLNPSQKIAVVNKVNVTGTSAPADLAKAIDEVAGTNVANTAAQAAQAADTTPTTIEDLYQQVLGRAPESKKTVDDWKKQFGDTIEPEEVEQFKQSAQLELTNPVVANLKGQILGQGTTGQWTGEGFGSAEANATDMAKILAGIGITDINQFGQITKEIPASIVGYTETGEPIESPAQTVTTYGNKLTGQEVPNTYSERQTGNAFGGTFAGSGNTGYRVDFSRGTPVFYTTGASSNDLVNLFADNPILSVVANYAAFQFGGPAGVAALQAAQGKSIEDIAKGALLAYVGGEIAGNVSGSTELVNTVGSDAANIIGKGVGKFVSSEGKADIISSLVDGAIDLGVGKITDNIDGFKDLTKGEQDFTRRVISTTIKNGGDLSLADVVDAALTAGTAATKAAKTGTIADSIQADKTINDAVTAEIDKQTTIDASGAMDVNAAATFAIDQGYTKFTFDGKTYNVGNNNAENTIANLEADALKTNTATNLAGGEFAGVDQAVTDAAKRNTVAIGNTEADNPDEAAALAKIRNPNGSQFTFGGQTYNMTASDTQMKNAVLESKLSEATTAADAKKIALAELGANVSFKWTDANGKEQTLVTASTPVTTANSASSTANATITNYVNDKLSKNLTSAEFNPADLTKDEMANFVKTYANATDAQKATLLKGADSMTFKVIDTLLKQTAALNPTGAGDVAAPAGSTTLKTWDKGSIATAVDVAKAAGNVAAADIAGLGVRGAQFLGDIMGQDTNSFAGVQNLLVNDKDKSMSKLIGNEKVIAGGIASGVESAVAWTLGGPMAGVATIAGVVANNSWVEGANAGLSVTDNAKRTAAMTALEVAGEMLGIPGMKAIMKGIPVTGSVTQIVDTLKRAGGGLLSENASELLTTVAQFSVDKFASFGLSKDATFDDFQKALKDTIIATTAAVGTSSGISTATRAASGVENRCAL